MLKIEKIAKLSQADLEMIFEAFTSKWTRLVRPYSFKKFSELYQSTATKEELYRLTWHDKVAGVFGLSGSFVTSETVPTITKKKRDWRWHLGMRLLTEQVAEDECYLSFIAVHKEFRGQGLGKVCLQFMTEFAENQPGINKVTLFVATSNQKAARLYQQQGFLQVQELKSLLTRYFIGEKQWTKMAKQVKDVRVK